MVDNRRLWTVIHRFITVRRHLWLRCAEIATEVLNVDLAVGQRTKEATKGRLRSQLNLYFNVADSYGENLRF